MRLIDAEAFLQAEINRCGCVPLVGTHTMNNEYLSEMLKSAPTIEAKPVVHAHWNDDGRCTNCGNFPLYDYFGRIKLSEICPHCGAQMDEVVDDE